MIDIEGYDGVYKVNILGEIFKMVDGALIKINPCKNSWGYMVFSMSKNGVRKMYKVHRVVAKYFVVNPAPKKFKQVNHLDGDKTNNGASNLEWTDNKRNNQHKAMMGLAHKYRKAISEETKAKILYEHINAGKGSCVLAKEFCISINSAHRIINNI